MEKALTMQKASWFYDLALEVEKQALAIVYVTQQTDTTPY